jgi:hypothetical protein
MTINTNESGHLKFVRLETSIETRHLKSVFVDNTCVPHVAKPTYLDYDVGVPFHYINSS